MARNKREKKNLRIIKKVKRKEKRKKELATDWMRGGGESRIQNSVCFGVKLAVTQMETEHRRTNQLVGEG